MLFFFLIKDGYTVLILYSMHRVVLKAFAQLMGRFVRK